MPDVLSFNEFYDEVARVLRLDLPEHLSSATILREELSLDSLQMVELLFLMEEFGAEVPDAMVAEVVEAGDLYAHYRSRITAHAEPPFA